MGAVAMGAVAMVAMSYDLELLLFTNCIPVADETVPLVRTVLAKPILNGKLFLLTSAEREDLELAASSSLVTVGAFNFLVVCLAPLLTVAALHVNLSPFALSRKRTSELLPWTVCISVAFETTMTLICTVLVRSTTLYCKLECMKAAASECRFQI